MRYIGMKYGFYPTDIQSQYECDKICDDFYDIFGKLSDVAFKGPGAELDAANKVAQDCLDKFLKGLPEKNKSGKFLMGDKPMTCDFWIGAYYLDYCCNPTFPGCDGWKSWLAAHPKFVEYGERFRAYNKAYLDKRAPSPF